MRIYLIGFMASGKTTMGRHVADKLQVEFLDIDEMIEHKSGMSIAEIFSTAGEDEFRKMEAATLRATAEYDKALIATGGGLPAYHHNMQWLTEHGVTMYFNWPDERLLASVINDKQGRPLLSHLTDAKAIEKAMSLLHERKPVYEQSSMTLDMAGEFEKDCKILERACKYIW